jgi:hypothetical protein
MAQLNELWGGLGALGKAAGQGIGKTASAVGGAIGGAAKNVAAGAQKAYNTAATGVKNVASNIKKTYNQGEINPEVSKLEGAAADLGKQIAALNKRMVGAGQQPLNVKSILATIQNQLGAGGQANLGKLRTAEGVVDPANIEVQPNVLKEEDETDEPETDSPEVATPETGEETPKETGIDAGEEAGIEANIEDAGEEPDKDADDVSFFGKDSQSLGGGVVKPDGAPTTAVDVTIEPDKTIQITMNEAKKKLIKQIAEGVNVYMSEISPIKKLEPVKSLPPVMNESEKKLRKYIRTRLEENAGLRKASLNENKKSTTLKKLDEIIDKQFKLFESVVLKKKDKLNEVLGLEKIGINLTTEEQVAAAFKKLNPNNQEEINRLFQIAFKNILINPHMSGIGVKAKIATPQEKYNLLGQYVKGGGGSLRLDKTGKLIYVSKEFQDKGTINKTVGGGTRTQNSNFGE